jgi:NMD protein affecting ribosome stability and mRNA decay
MPIDPCADRCSRCGKVIDEAFGQICDDCLYREEVQADRRSDANDILREMQESRGEDD